MVGIVSRPKVARGHPGPVDKDKTKYFSFTVLKVSEKNMLGTMIFWF